MAYSDFTLPQVLQTYHLRVETRLDLFAGVPDAPVRPALREALALNLPLALAINTEKARSEWLIAPVLGDLWQSGRGQISLFSGVDFNVDLAEGLNGWCDFLVTRGPQLPFITAPVLAVVEAKNESIAGGLGQCAAVMVAAQRFNREAGNGIETVHGLVTTGDNWKFLRLHGSVLAIDINEYLISQLERILGILVHVVGPLPQPATAA
jgi:hypothetical protein